MTDRLRAAIQVALEALENDCDWSVRANAARALREAFGAEPIVNEPEPLWADDERAALAEREDAEPVAWMSWADGEGVGYWATQAEAELNCSGDTEPVPLYTHPPRREWVGLTEEERIKAIESVYERLPFDIRKARAIEAALKEKNHD